MHDKSDIGGLVLSGAIAGYDSAVRAALGPSHIDEGLESTANSCSGNVEMVLKLTFGWQENTFSKLSGFNVFP